MPQLSRRTVDGSEFVVVQVEFSFNLESATRAVMAARSTVRVRRGVPVRPLRVSEVREALRYAARHGQEDPHPVVVQLARERDQDGELHRLAAWARAELIRLGLFSESAELEPQTVHG